MRTGKWASRWCARKYSTADGFVYEAADFCSHAEAVAHVQERCR